MVFLDGDFKVFALDQVLERADAGFQFGHSHVRLERTRVRMDNDDHHQRPHSRQQKIANVERRLATYRRPKCNKPEKSEISIRNISYWLSLTLPSHNAIDVNQVLAEYFSKCPASGYVTVQLDDDARHRY